MVQDAGGPDQCLFRGVLRRRAGAPGGAVANNPPMTLQHVQVALQALSSFAIAGGAIFAAYQFLQWRKTQYVANFAKLVELQMHLREMRVHDPGLARVYRHDVQGLNTDEDIRLYFFNLMQLSVYEIVWFSFRHGQIPADYYRSWSDRMRSIVAEDSFQRMMSSPAMKILHDDFQRLIVGMMGDDRGAAAAQSVVGSVP